MPLSHFISHRHRLQCIPYRFIKLNWNSIITKAIYRLGLNWICANELEKAAKWTRNSSATYIYNFNELVGILRTYLMSVFIRGMNWNPIWKMPWFTYILTHATKSYTCHIQMYYSMYGIPILFELMTKKFKFTS